MGVLHEDVRNVSGIYFQLTDNIKDFIDVPEKITYLIYLKDTPKTGDLEPLLRLIRFFTFPYRIVLIEDGTLVKIGLIIYGFYEEKEEIDSTMNWIAETHPKWVVEENVSTIIGYRIANNLFHAKKLILQGEILV